VSSRWILQGPFPVDLRDPGSAARAAADVAQRWLRVQQARAELADLGSTASEPGLYLIWSADPTPAVAGFWVSFGSEYLIDGPPGPPDREVPFVRDLLNALTESVWWQNLTVTPLERSVWRPVIVLEWLPSISSRSPFAPPGVAVARRRPEEEEADEGGGGWLIPNDDGLGIQRETSDGLTDFLEPVDILPAARSVVTVVRGELRKGLTSHSGRFEPVDGICLDGSRKAHRIPLGDWLTRATLAGPVGPPEAEMPAHGPPLGLPGERIGFPVYGWLTRSLGVWPPNTRQVRLGEMQSRDIGVRWLRQLRMASSITVGVILAGLALAAAIVIMTRPALRAAPPAPRQAPQPALSLCSADHEEFMAELRCQLDHISRGGDPDAAVCRDLGSSVNRKVRDYVDQRLANRNLHPAWCGIHDRTLDGFASPDGQSDWTQLVAARSCFNVLGHPYTYTWAFEGTGGSADWPNPGALLEPGNLQVKPLADLVGELNGTCDAVRPQLERNVEGAILAAHIGTPASSSVAVETLGDGGRLRRAMTMVAEEGMRRGEADCFEAGIDRGVGDATRYGALCRAESDSGVFRPVSRSDSWTALAGAVGDEAEAKPIIEAYVASRFPPKAREYPPMWRCHLELDGVLQRSGKALSTRWDLRAPMPPRYRSPAKVSSQLVLDSALLAFDDGVKPDACWSVLAERLTRYRPVHPLVGPLADEGWPSAEQQLCGQICATRYRVAHSDAEEAWHTPSTDLAMCVREDAPSADGPALDQLRLPWNGDVPDRWRLPEPEDVCGFNLVAQGYLPAGEVPLLAGEVSAFDWAGEADLGEGVAGGRTGLAAKAAHNLGSYGRARSVETCGYAATQCLTAGLLEVTGDRTGDRQDWSRLWSGWMTRLVRARPRELEQTDPWCALIHPYLPRAGRLPEGQLDFPCAKGVDDVRQAVEDSLNELAVGAADRQGG